MKKRYAYTYEDYEDNNKSSQTMVADILADPEFAQVDSVEIGSWGDCWEGGSQAIVDAIIDNKNAFDHIEELSIGIMDYEDCEISWIIQADYEKLFPALPHLKHLTIQGSSELSLGSIAHDQLESLEIICGGLPQSVINSVAQAKLPHLRKLVLYLGIENYGFDGSVEDMKAALAQMDFPNLTYLGIVDSELQDEMIAAVLACPFVSQLTTLDFSCGSLTDKGGALLLEAVPKLPNLQKLDLHYHYMSQEMMDKLAALPIEVDISDQNEREEYNGHFYYDPMITE